MNRLIERDLNEPDYGQLTWQEEDELLRTQADHHYTDMQESGDDEWEGFL